MCVCARAGVCSCAPEKGTVIVEKNQAQDFDERLKRVESNVESLYASQMQNATMLMSQRDASPAVGLLTSLAPALLPLS